jgi:hypothetical protein
MRYMLLAVLLVVLLSGCATTSVDGYKWEGGDQSQFYRNKASCLKEANSVYIPLAAAIWATKIRLTLYKDCMEKAGYVKAL